MTWPLLKAPKENVYWTWREDIFTDQEMDKIIEQGLEAGVRDATLGLGSVDSYRASGVSWMSTDDPELDWIYEKLEPLIRRVNEEYFNYDLTHILPLQFTTYDESNEGHYKPHIDIGQSQPNRKLTFSLQLSDPFSHEGGTLQFPYNRTEPEIAPRARGKIIFFPSFMLHEVTPVTKGTRYSLVGWVAGPLFR